MLSGCGEVLSRCCKNPGKFFCGTRILNDNSRHHYEDAAEREAAGQRMKQNTEILEARGIVRMLSSVSPAISPRAQKRDKLSSEILESFSGNIPGVVASASSSALEVDVLPMSVVPSSTLRNL